MTFKKKLLPLRKSYNNNISLTKDKFVSTLYNISLNKFKDNAHLKQP